MHFCLNAKHKNIVKDKFNFLNFKILNPFLQLFDTNHVKI